MSLSKVISQNVPVKNDDFKFRVRQTIDEVDNQSSGKCTLANGVRNKETNEQLYL